MTSLQLDPDLVHPPGGGTDPRKVRVGSPAAKQMKLSIFANLKKGGLSGRAYPYTFSMGGPPPPPGFIPTHVTEVCQLSDIPIDVTWCPICTLGTCLTAGTLLWRHRQWLLGKLLHFPRNYFVSTGALAGGMCDITHSWLTDHKHSSRKSTLKSLVPFSYQFILTGNPKISCRNHFFSYEDHNLQTQGGYLL